MPTEVKRASVVGTFEDFVRRFDQISGGIARELAELPGLVFAGGSVVAALTDSICGDVDIFICCPGADCVEALKSVHDATQRVHRRHNGDTPRAQTHEVIIFSPRQQ